MRLQRCRTAFIMAGLLAGVLACAPAQAARATSREQAIDRVIMLYADSFVASAEPDVVDGLLKLAKAVNPEANDAVWESVRSEVGPEFKAIMIRKGGMLDGMLRQALEPMSTGEIRHLRRVLADPAYVKFQASISAPKAQQAFSKAISNAGSAMLIALNGLLEKRGLNPVH